MKTNRLKIAVTACLGSTLIICSAVAKADVFTQMLSALTNIQQYTQQMQNMENNELPNLSQINQNLTKYMYGDTGIENILNGQSDMNQRLWSNANWNDVLNQVGGGTYSGFQQQQQAYAQMYPTQNKEQIGQTLTDNDLVRTYYQQNQEVSRAALAASSYSYNTINQHMQNIQSILLQIKNTPTEKASIDMNARLLAEVSYIQLEMLRQQNVQTQLMATQSQGVVNAMSDESKFDQWNP